MTLISFIAVRPPAPNGVAMTFMCTTVSTCADAITLAMSGLRMSARTNSVRPTSVARRHDVDADDALDRGVGGELRGQPAPEVAGDAGHQDDAGAHPATVVGYVRRLVRSRRAGCCGSRAITTGSPRATRSSRLGVARVHREHDGAEGVLAQREPAAARRRRTSRVNGTSRVRPLQRSSTVSPS